MVAGTGRGVLTGHLPYGLLLAFHTRDGSSELVVCSWLLTAAVERAVGRQNAAFHMPALEIMHHDFCHRLPDSRSYTEQGVTLFLSATVP